MEALDLLRTSIHEAIPDTVHHTHELWLETAKKEGKIPLPLIEDRSSGKILARTPKSLHKAL